MYILTPAKSDNLSQARENNLKTVIANILAALDLNVQILLAISTRSKMISPGDHAPLRKVLLQDAKILTHTQ